MKNNCNKIVLEYINKYEDGEPIFIEDVQDYVMGYYKKQEKNDVYNNIKVILYRLEKCNIIRTFYRGVYYKPKENIFGEVAPPVIKTIKYKYLEDREGNIKGYITGAKLFNKLGLTTQVSNILDIVTNECKNNNKYFNKYLNVVIRKPKIEITNDNYKYLQLFDFIENKDKINIEIENEDDIIYKFIEENNLEFEKILKYAREVKSKKILEKILVIAK